MFLVFPMCDGKILYCWHTLSQALTLFRAPPLPLHVSLCSCTVCLGIPVVLCACRTSLSRRLVWCGTGRHDALDRSRSRLCLPSTRLPASAARRGGLWARFCRLPRRVSIRLLPSPSSRPPSQISRRCVRPRLSCLRTVQQQQ